MADTTQSDREAAAKQEHKAKLEGARRERDSLKEMNDQKSLVLLASTDREVKEVLGLEDGKGCDHLGRDRLKGTYVLRESKGKNVEHSIKQLRSTGQGLETVAKRPKPSRTKTAGQVIYPSSKLDLKPQVRIETDQKPGKVVSLDGGYYAELASPGHYLLHKHTEGEPKVMTVVVGADRLRREFPIEVLIRPKPKD